MDQPAQPPATIDAYIAAAPVPVQPLLEALRGTIRAAAPGAVEAISYAMPTFKLQGNLVHFAAFQGHIGLYPTPSAVRADDPEVAPYIAGKGTLRFPLDEPLPLALIDRIVRQRVAENLEKAAARKRKKKAGPA